PQLISGIALIQINFECGFILDLVLVFHSPVKTLQRLKSTVVLCPFREFPVHVTHNARLTSHYGYQTT
ncbi:TPA: hypothetical protein ACGTTK_003070, partial [Vibrio parahaemolyticus]